MPTAAQIMDGSAALLNDTEQVVFTDAAQLPYLNIALQELQEHFELNNVPVTNEVSAVIAVDAGTDTIGFSTSPALPSDLIEIQQLWERARNIDPFIPMTRREFLPHYLEGQEINQFIWWVWSGQEIRLLPADADNDLKIDYIQSLFVEITDVNTNIPVLNSTTFLEYRTAGLCSRFIGENPTRADQLDSFALLALDRTTGISTKGRQAIAIRRKPFRASYKTRNYL